MKKILVIGSTNTDFVLKVGAIPQVGETVMSRSFQQLPGGKGANQAYACGMLGGRVTFLSAIGEDGLGGVVMENMRRAHVETRYIRTTNEDSTGMAVICVDETGNNSIVVVPGANLYCDCGYLMDHRDAIDMCDILLVQLEVPVEGIFSAVEYAHKRGKTVILNPAPCPDSIPDDVLQNVDYITPNETELQKLTGCRMDCPEGVREGAETLLRRGAGQVIVTLGSKGAMFCNDSKTEHFPAWQVPVADTTAAGDTFNGAIAVALAEGKGIEEAIRFANAASSLAVSRKGAQTSVPSRAEVDKFMNDRGGI
ncbi:MAG: ribokinase [Oscillospiraceae bacterium]|nr:ribokinase [Oscillospiraceae bacterium]